MPPKKMTATDQKRYAEMVQVATETLWDFRHPDFVRAIMPREWKVSIRAKPMITMRFVNVCCGVVNKCTRAFASPRIVSGSI